MCITHLSLEELYKVGYVFNPDQDELIPPIIALAEVVLVNVVDTPIETKEPLS
jgi:hypothetical protein